MMGYLSDGRFVTTSTNITRIELEIMEEMKKVYKRRFGREFTESGFNQLSSQEQNDIIHEAGVRIQDRRKGRLVI